MKILLSPAKSLDEQSAYPDLSYTIPQFLKKTNQLARILKSWDVKDFSQIMKLSDTLAELNYERYQNWISPDKASRYRRPAIFSFTGEVYKGLNISTLAEEHYSTLNETVCILSGLYGVLRPFDWMFPYRLEMGTKADFNGYRNLYGFWGTSIVQHLNKVEKSLIFNLASEEYFKAARLKEVKARVITPVFKDYKNGKPVIVMMYAKHQRGQFARFIIENPDLSTEECKLYKEDGYLYREELSSENEWCFVRQVIT